MENESRLAESEEKNDALEVSDAYEQTSRNADVLMRDLDDDPFDEKKEDDKASCPTGGCSNDTKTYKDIYNDRLDTAIKKAKTDNPNFDIRDRAQWRGVHMKVAKSMRPEVRHNREYLKADKEGPAFAKGPEFTILSDGRIFYPKFGEKGKTLQEMYEDQKRLRPHEYNPKEHATMTMMEEAFRNGATKVSHVSHNKNEQGNEAIRDQITMIWDPISQKGQMEIRNIAQDGNFHSVEKAIEIIGERSGMIAVHPTEGVGIFVDKAIPQSRVASIVETYGIENRQQEHGKEHSHEDTRRIEISEAVIDGVLDTAEHVGKRAQAEMTIVSKNIQRLIADEVENKRIFVPPFLQRLLGLSGQSSDINLPAEVALVNSLDLPDLVVVEDKKSEVHEGAENGVVVAAETGVGVGGAIFLLDQLLAQDIENETKEFLSDQLVELQSESESTFISEELKGAVVAFFESNEPPIVLEHTIDLLESIQVGEVQTESMLEKEQVDMESLGKIRDIITVINEAPVEQAIAVIEHEEEVVIIQMSEAWEVFEELLQEHQGAERVEAKQEVEAHVEQFSLLVTMWLLFKLDSYRQSLVALKDVVLGKKDSDSVLAALKEEIPTKLIPKEPTPWILLGIIWHLNQIREQGFVATSQNATVVVPKKKKTHSLPARGIIFAHVT